MTQTIQRSHRGSDPASPPANRTDEISQLLDQFTFLLDDPRVIELTRRWPLFTWRPLSIGENHRMVQRDVANRVVAWKLSTEIVLQGVHRMFRLRQWRLNPLTAGAIPFTLTDGIDAAFDL